VPRIKLTDKLLRAGAALAVPSASCLRGFQLRAAARPLTVWAAI